MRRGVLVLLLAAAAVVIAILLWRDGPEPSPTPPASSSGSQADLTITSATVQRVADPDMCGGFTLCLIVTVANRGSADVTGLQDGCGTSSFGDPEPWTDFTLDGSVPAGGSETFRSGYPNLEPYLPATFTLFCEVDAVDRIEESREDNNTFTTTVSL